MAHQTHASGSSGERDRERMVVKEDSAIKEMKLHVYSELLKKEKNCETHFLPFSPGLRASLVAQLVKNLPAMQETWV